MDLDLCVVTIRLRSGIHLGERENRLEGTGTLPFSDTLFSAFCNGYRLMYGSSELTILLQAFLDGTPPFRISSAFPEWEGFRFFPVPLNQMAPEKKWKKIRWIEQSGWERLLRGELIKEVAKSPSARFIPREEPDCEQGDNRDFRSAPWEVLETPRVGLDRMSSHPGERYFQFAQVHFSRDSSFFFLVKVEREDLWPRIRAVWRLLGDEGLGGDRSVGKGLFLEPLFSNLALSAPDNADSQVLLSHFYPLESETVRVPQGYYELAERKGYLYSPSSQGLRRQGVRLFKTGSVFPGTHPLRGRLVDVTPGVFSRHRIYRYGIALGIPCMLEGGSHVG